MYRINIFPTQMNLLEKYPGASEVLENIVRSSPRRQLKTRTWLIGNIGDVGKDFIYFRFGRDRTFKKTIWAKDHFDDVEDYETPYCHILLNFKLEYFLVSQNSRVASSIPSIVRQLNSLFSSTEIANQFGLEFEFRPVRNSVEFVDRLKRARIVKRFWFTVSRPNVSDAGQATRDLEKFTRDLGGTKSRLSTEGNIDRDDAVNLAKVAASNGQDAGAVFKVGRERRWTRSSIGKNNVEFGESEEALKNDQVRIAAELAARYRETRNG